MNRAKASKRFYYLHKILNNDSDYEVELLDFCYYKKRAIDYVKKLNREFFMNSYYNLKISDILDYAKEHKTLKEVKKSMYEDYKPYYASAWFENMVYVLGQ